MPSDGDLLKLIRGNKDAEVGKLYVVSSSTASTFVFQGTQKALSANVFEIPEDLKPIYPGERFYALPIAGEGTNRWGILQRITRTKKELILCPYKCPK